MEEESRNSPPGPWKVQQRFIWIVNPETGLEEDKLMEVANLDHDVRKKVTSGRIDLQMTIWKEVQWSGEGTHSLEVITQKANKSGQIAFAPVLPVKERELADILNSVHLVSSDKCLWLRPYLLDDDKDSPPSVPWTFYAPPGSDAYNQLLTGTLKKPKVGDRLSALLEKQKLAGAIFCCGPPEDLEQTVLTTLLASGSLVKSDQNLHTFARKEISWEKAGVLPASEHKDKQAELKDGDQAANLVNPLMENRLRPPSFPREPSPEDFRKYSKPSFSPPKEWEKPDSGMVKSATQSTWKSVQREGGGIGSNPLGSRFSDLSERNALSPPNAPRAAAPVQSWPPIKQSPPRRKDAGRSFPSTESGDAGRNIQSAFAPPTLLFTSTPQVNMPQRTLAPSPGHKRSPASPSRSRSPTRPSSSSSYGSSKHGIDRKSSSISTSSYKKRERSLDRGRALAGSGARWVEGDRVEAQFESGPFFVAKIVGVHSDGTYKIKYVEDGEIRDYVREELTRSPRRSKKRRSNSRDRNRNERSQSRKGSDQRSSSGVGSYRDRNDNRRFDDRRSGGYRKEGGSRNYR